MYGELVYIKNESIDGLTGWLWPKADQGLWAGPKEEWPSFRDIILEHTPQKRTVIQAGGGCGMYPRLLAEHFETVHTFEPFTLNFHCLVNNCQMERILKYNAALGDKHAMIDLVYHDNNNFGMQTTIEGTKIAQLCIDDLDVPSCDLIFLDVEGSEYKVLKGAAKTIKKHKPLIIVESTTEEITKLLAAQGYGILKTMHFDTIYKVKE